MRSDLAVGLTPQIMETPTWDYPLLVGAGTTLLVVFTHGLQFAAAKKNAVLDNR